MSQQHHSPMVMAVGRFFLALIFVISGWQKLTHAAGVIPMLQSHHLPWPGLTVYVAGAIEFFGGLALIIGWRAREAALLLCLFLIPTTLIFHTSLVVPFKSAMEVRLNWSHMLLNFSVMGGLLLAAARSSEQERDGTHG